MLNGDLIRQVSVNLALIDPSVLKDWVVLYKSKGEAGIQDTNARRNYRNEDEQYKVKID